MNEQAKNWQPGDRQEDMPARKSNGSEMQEWFASLEPALEFVLKNQEPLKATRFLDKLVGRLREAGVKVPQVVSTPYINTIPVEQQKPYPGDWKTEVRIKSFIRWNAMAMVVNANAKHDGLGGHISTFASSATLYEVAFIISSAAVMVISPGTLFISRATLRPVFMPAHFSNVASTSGICKISARNSPKAAGCRLIRILI